MSAVATVADKLDRRSTFRDGRFRGKTYINRLIRPDGNGRWKYDENDRHKRDRHKDWLRRLADHEAMRKEPFRYARIYNTGRFSDSDVVVAEDYIVFSQAPDKTYISPRPPLVAVAQNSEHERWISDELRQLTVDIAAKLHPRGRNFLRSESRAYQHRQLTFELPSDEAVKRRQLLISRLRQLTASNHDDLDEGDARRFG
jgi:hypothetical protein